MTVYVRELPVQKDGARRRVWTASVGSGSDRVRKDFPTKRAAEAWHADMLTRVHNGTATGASSRMSVADLWPKYEEYLIKRCDRGERVSHKYLFGIQGIVKNYIICTHRAPDTKGSRRRPFEAGLGNMKLSSLTPARVERFKDDLSDAGMSIPTTRAVLRVLSSMLAFGISRDFVRVNAVEGVRVIGHRDEGSKKIVPPSPILMRAVIAAASDDFRVLIKFLTVSGARIGEALALRWRDIDWDEGSVHIHTRLDPRSMMEDAYGAKSAAGNRHVPIGKAVIDDLALARKGSRFSAENDLIFCGRTGHYRSQGNDRKRLLYPLYEKVAPSVPAKSRMSGAFGFHALRHYAISAWIAAGLPLKAISVYAGHSSVQITTDRYGHLFPSDDYGAIMDAIASQLEPDEVGSDGSGPDELRSEE